MSISTRNRRFHYLGAVVAAVAISLVALAIPTSSAKAQEWFGFQLGPFAFGVGAPAYSYPYYSYPYSYYYPYYYYPRYYPGYYYYGY